MSLTKDLSKIGSIANALYSSITANTTAITSINAAVVDINTGANIASASTINLNTATGNRVHITGTTTITTVTLTRGPRTVIFDGILTLTHDATTNNLPGAANITTAAGDRAIYESDGTTVFCVNYIKASGTAVTPSGGITTAATITGNTTLTAASAGYQYIATTVLGRSITLPDATTVTIGSPKFYLDNTSGGYPVGIRNSAGTLLMGIAAGGAATVSCQSISSAAGVWSITGTNLEPGLITIDNMFSSTYTFFQGNAGIAFVTLDANKSIHFIALSSGGFAAVAVDNITSAVGTPVTVSTTADMRPRTAFMITSTTAIVFYSSTTGTLISVVISLSGATTLSVGTASSTLTAAGVAIENFKDAPKIAQLAPTLYLVSYATASGAGTTSVAAFQVSGGTTVTLGSAVNIIAANNVFDSTTTYALTATTALVIYLSGESQPFPISAVVISVTNANPPVCTVGTPVAGGTFNTILAPASCLLSPTKVLTGVGRTGIFAGVQAFTIAGTTVSVGATLTVETGTVSNAMRYNGSGNEAPASRYKPILFPLTSTTALFSYNNAFVSRTVIVTESAGTVTNGSIIFQSISSGTADTAGSGSLLPQGTTEFMSLTAGVTATVGENSLGLVPHKISGTTITVGVPLSLLDIVGTKPSATHAVRLSTGQLVVGFSNLASGQSGTGRIKVVRSNGDYINDRGSMSIPRIGVMDQPVAAVSSNRIIAFGRTLGSIGTAEGDFLFRLTNIEIAA